MTDAEKTPEQQRLSEAALAYAREHKKRIGKERTDPAIFTPEEQPVSVFMAGSPGAGKTEASKELIANIEERSPGSRVLRIDPDELRCLLPGYDGSNSWLFQGAVSTLVDKILDLAYKQKQSFLLDGTLADVGRARTNIERALRKERAVQILYVYQDPMLAWEFVQARELEEGRRIPPERFIEQYFAARDVVNQLKGDFGSRIAVDLLVKPHSMGERIYRAGIDQIDYHVPEKYTRDQLRERLGLTSGAS